MRRDYLHGGSTIELQVLHRTYAEYFVSLLILRILQNSDVSGAAFRQLYSFFIVRLSTKSWSVVAALLWSHLASPLQRMPQLRGIQETIKFPAAGKAKPVSAIDATLIPPLLDDTLHSSCGPVATRPAAPPSSSGANAPTPVAADLTVLATFVGGAQLLTAQLVPQLKVMLNANLWQFNAEVSLSLLKLALADDFKDAAFTKMLLRHQFDLTQADIQRTFFELLWKRRLTHPDSDGALQLKRSPDGQSVFMNELSKRYEGLAQTYGHRDTENELFPPLSVHRLLTSCIADCVSKIFVDCAHSATGWSNGLSHHIVEKLLWPFLTIWKADVSTVGGPLCGSESWQQALPYVNMTAFALLLVEVLEFFSYTSFLSPSEASHFESCVLFARGFAHMLLTRIHSQSKTLTVSKNQVALLVRLLCILARLSGCSLVYDEPSERMWLVGYAHPLQVDLCSCREHRLLPFPRPLVDMLQQRAMHDTLKDAQQLTELHEFTDSWVQLSATANTTG